MLSLSGNELVKVSKEETFYSQILDLNIDGPGRSLIGVQTDSGVVILSRPNELSTSTSDWKQTKIGTGEAAYGITEAGLILAISICIGGAVCFHKETGFVVSTHTVESTGSVGSHPSICLLYTSPSPRDS